MQITPVDGTNVSRQATVLPSRPHSYSRGHTTGDRLLSHQVVQISGLDIVQWTIGVTRQRLFVGHKVAKVTSGRPDKSIALKVSVSLVRSSAIVQTQIQRVRDI